MSNPISLRIDKELLEEVDLYAKMANLDRTKLMTLFVEAGLNQIVVTGELKVSDKTRLVFDEIKKELEGK